jgi:hypothetical protein
MSIRKSLIAVAAMALALMGFASSAMAATDGVIRDTVDNSIIPANREVHLIGWAKFDTSSGNYECHVTSVLKVTGSTGTTGHVKTFTVPDRSKCTGSGFLSGCTLTAFSNNTEGLHPWHVTVTPPSETIPAGDFDVKPESESEKIEIHNTFGGSCFGSGQSVTLKFSTITLKPLQTGTTTITGVPAGTGHLGGTATAAEPKIAGAEISGTGTVEGGLGGSVTATGELEVTEADRCTWKITAS